MGGTHRTNVQYLYAIKLDLSRGLYSRFGFHQPLGIVAAVSNLPYIFAATGVAVACSTMSNRTSNIQKQERSF